MKQRGQKIGIVSLGCPKALVDSERILTRLRAEGYDLAAGPDAARDAGVVIVNTCGFLDSAKAESLEAIGEAMAENGRVIVTGCMGGDEAAIRAVHPDVLAVSGPHQYEAVVKAVHDALPPDPGPHAALVPPEGVRLTPRHYAYLKISEGCGHGCSFCIIPAIRGPLSSRPLAEVLAEAERLALAGVRELLVVAQDTAAYGQDLRHEEASFRGRAMRTHLTDLARALGDFGMWVRLHYLYPYPVVDQLLPLMADGTILPYLDVPFQHASPAVLEAMRRPARQEKMLERIASWRRAVPDLTIRSTFVVGFPGETEEDFEFLLDWLDEAELDRVGCFVYEPVAGAAANALPDPVDADEASERQQRLMELQRQIGAERLARLVGRRLPVIVDEVDADGTVTARTQGDAPEIDGVVHLDPHDTTLHPGDIVDADITAGDDFDLWAETKEIK